MNKLENTSEEIVALTEGIKNNYNYEIDVFLKTLSEENEIKLSVWTLEKNKKLGLTIMKNYISYWNFNSTLMWVGYSLFDELSVESFNEELENDKDLINSILSWKILIWYLDNFSKIIIVTKSIKTSEEVDEILN